MFTCRNQKPTALKNISFFYNYFKIFITNKWIDFRFKNTIQYLRIWQIKQKLKKFYLEQEKRRRKKTKSIHWKFIRSHFCQNIYIERERETRNKYWSNIMQKSRDSSLQHLCCIQYCRCAIMLLLMLLIVLLDGGGGVSKWFSNAIRIFMIFEKNSFFGEI